MICEKSWAIFFNTTDSLNEIFDFPSVFSPNRKYLAQLQQCSVEFHSETDITYLPFQMEQGELLLSISTVFTSPWIMAAGSSLGTIYFFSLEKVLFSVSVCQESITKLSLCHFNDGAFVQEYPVLMAISRSQDFSFLQLSDVKKRIDFTCEIPVQRWHLNHPFIDALIISSRLSQSLVNGLTKFPIVISIGAPNFLTVSSIQKPSAKNSESLTAVASKFFRWIAGSPVEEDKTIKVSKSSTEWSIKDEGRVGKELSADSSGRWVAVIDSNSRVLVLDSIFGNIVTVLKGLRGAQIGWIEPNFLAVYSSHRESMILCQIPQGKTIDAIKLNKKGKIFQLVDEERKRSVAFVSHDGHVLQIKAQIVDTSSSKFIFEAFHFSVPDEFQHFSSQ